MVATLVPNPSTVATDHKVDFNMNNQERSETTTSSSLEIEPIVEAVEVTTPAAISLEGWNNSAFGSGIQKGEQHIEVSGDTITMVSQNSGNNAGEI